MSEEIGTIDPVEPMDGDGSTCLQVYASPGRVELNTIPCILSVRDADRLCDLLALAIVKADGLPAEPELEGAIRVRLERKTRTGEPATDVERLDGVAIAAWLDLAFPGLQPDPTGSGISFTRVYSYGRQALWPGDPDDVAAWLGASGFKCRLRRAQGSRETFVEVIEPGEPAPDWPSVAVSAMNAAALERPDLAWVLRRFQPGDRVVAEREIVYGTGQTVEEGTRGTVVRMEAGGVPVVRVVWDALAEGDPYELATSCESVAAAAAEGDPA